LPRRIPGIYLLVRDAPPPLGHFSLIPIAKIGFGQPRETVTEFALRPAQYRPFRLKGADEALCMLFITASLYPSPPPLCVCPSLPSSRRVVQALCSTRVTRIPLVLASLRSPLHLSCLGGHPQIGFILLGQSTPADPPALLSLRDAWGATALHLCALCPHVHLHAGSTASAVTAPAAGTMAGSAAGRGAAGGAAGGGGGGYTAGAPGSSTSMMPMASAAARAARTMPRLAPRDALAGSGGRSGNECFRRNTHCNAT